MASSTAVAGEEGVAMEPSTWATPIAWGLLASAIVRIAVSATTQAPASLASSPGLRGGSGGASLAQWAGRALNPRLPSALLDWGLDAHIREAVW
jgi:hypothetical protein